MISRDYYYQKIVAGFKNNPIVVLIGARQVGKTSLMEMFVEDKKHYWLNGQNPETAALFESFSSIERYLQLNIGNNLDGLLVIDEFQYINDISLYLKLLCDKYKKLKVLCSGSSSLNILQSVEESLAGRIRLINVYPLSFDEYIKFQDLNLWEKFNHCTLEDDINLMFPEIPEMLNEYLTYGGLPKVALASNKEEKEELLNDIYQTYLLKDVRQFIKNQHFLAFNKLLKILSSQTAELININEISNTIQLPYRNCEEYVGLLEQMFIITLVYPYTTNQRKEITKMKKMFFCDIGLRNVIYNSFNDISIRIDKGQIFENFVYLQFLKKYKPREIFYYRTKDNTEIDFILDTARGIIPIEVKFSEYRDHKKIRAISEFAKTNNFIKSYVINKSLINLTDPPYYVQPYKVIEL